MDTRYEDFTPAEFFARVQTEQQAREWLWQAKHGGRDFCCPGCGNSAFYTLRTRPEVRKCRQCGRHVRLRVGTMLENTKLPILVWVRALYLIMQDKCGISALQLQRQLRMKSYGTTWILLHKVRHALGQRDAQYKLKGLIELDGADFRRQAHSDAARVLVAIETKDWVDHRGRRKSRAGFAKVLTVGSESRINAQQFAREAIEDGTLVNTDGNRGLHELGGLDVDYQFMLGHKEVLDRWLPWVHKFISNAKTWLMGTHHGIRAKYLPSYMAEYTYRFNRRHAPDSLFHRALRACATATPITAGALLG